MKLLTCTWMACSSSSHSSSIICKRLSTGRKSTSLQDLGICVDGWQRRKCSLSDSLCARMNMQARGPMNTHWSWISSGFGPKYIYFFFAFRPPEDGCALLRRSPHDPASWTCHVKLLSRSGRRFFILYMWRRTSWRIAGLNAHSDCLAAIIRA